MSEDKHASARNSPSEQDEGSLIPEDEYEELVIRLGEPLRSPSRDRRRNSSNSTTSEYRDSDVDAGHHNDEQVYNLSRQSGPALAQQLSVMTSHLNATLRQNNPDMTDEDRKQFILSTVQLSLEKAGYEGCELELDFDGPDRQASAGGEWTARSSNQWTTNRTTVFLLGGDDEAAHQNNNNDHQGEENQ